MSLDYEEPLWGPRCKEDFFEVACPPEWRGNLPVFRQEDAPLYIPGSIPEADLKNINCYALAVNNFVNGFINPGQITLIDNDSYTKRIKDFVSHYNATVEQMQMGRVDARLLADTFLEGALLDGCLQVKPGEHLPEGYYLSAMIAFTEPAHMDFHLMAMYNIKERDGRDYFGWIQKNGRSDITLRDERGALLIDHREACFEYKSTFVSFLAVPSSGLKTGKPFFNNRFGLSGKYHSRSCLISITNSVYTAKVILAFAGELFIVFFCIFKIMERGAYLC